MRASAIESRSVLDGLVALGALLVSATPHDVYSDVASVVRRYYEGDDTIVDAASHTKRVVNESITVSSPAVGQRASRQLSIISIYGDDLALAKTETAEQDVSFLTLFRTEHGWRVASETTAAPEQGTHETRFNPVTSEDSILHVLSVYYESVDASDGKALRDALHTDWHMKNLENGALYAEPLEAFIRRVVEHGPYPGYADDRQVIDVQIIRDHMALVVVDKPSSGSLVAFSFFNVAGKWWIVDKAWTTR